MRRYISRYFRKLLEQHLAPCIPLRDERGSALVELALMISILGVPLLLGTSAVGVLAYDSIEITNAAHAAAMYGMQGNCCILQTAQMVTIAQGEASHFGTNLTVTPTSYYACSASQAGPTWTGTSGVVDDTSLATAKTNCTGSAGHVLAFVKVVASTPVSVPFSCCGFPSSITLSSQSVMEAEELP
jgi:Flp pilus assembly protein TadG